MFFRAVGAGMLILALLGASPAFATPQLRVVTNTNDNGAGSLRQAIIDADASNTGDTILFQSGVTGTITLTSGSLVIEHSLEIDGPGASALAVSGGLNSRVFVVDLNATVSISGLTVEEGQFESGDGGGIENLGTLTLTDGAVSANSAKEGAGVHSTGTLTLTNCAVSDNNDITGGGGIGIGDGTATLTNVTVSGNTAVQNGAGIEIFPKGAVTLTNSTVSNNDTSQKGGGIAVEGTGILTIINSTVSANSATVGAGGILNSATMTMINSTVSDNTAPSDAGGGIGIDTGTHTKLKNTIVADNPLGGNCLSAGPTFTSLGHNLSDDTSCNSLFNGTGDINNTPAGLDSLGLKDNGGPTQTIALLASSAAVDTVPVTPTNFCTATNGTTPIAADQRGIARPQGAACDIGAFELVPATPTPTPTATTTATRTATPTATPTPLGKLGASPLSMTLKTTNEAPVSKPVLVKNKGNGPLSVTVTGPKHNPPFSIDVTAMIVAPNSTSTVTITFAPTRKGIKTDAIHIKSAKPRKSIEIFLTGESK